MEFSWRIFVAVCVANTLCIGVMLLTQAMDSALPARHSIIPGTSQEFLYIQDFYTMTYGDLFGVPFILNAFVHLAVKDKKNIWRCLLFGALCTEMFLIVCLGEHHKPDYGFPEAGKISLAGILHLFYFTIATGASVVCLWNFFTGKLVGPVLYLALVGGMIYLNCFAKEVNLGNFNSLKGIKV